MGTKRHNNYEDLITFTRASEGYALRPVSYGSELVTNGTFDSDISGIWTDLLSTSTWEGSYLESVSTASGRGPYQVFTTVAGKIYRATGDVLSTTGEVMIRVGNGTTPDAGIADSNSATSAESLSVVFIAESTTSYVYLRHANAGTAEWDNISVKEVTFDESDGTLTLFEHPNNIPRVEYDADGNRLGLLVEESRTNLIASSGVEDWTNASGGTFAEITEAITETTLGAFTGLTVISQGETWHRTTSPTFSVTSGTTYTITVFYKTGTSGGVYIDFRIPTNSTVIKGTAGALTVNSNSAGTGTILSQETLPDGVYKIVFTVAANATASNAIVGIGPNSTTVGETVIALAAQVEGASFGSSYIKTTGSTASRSADVPTINTSEFGFNAKNFTVLCEWDTIIPAPVQWPTFTKIITLQEANGTENASIVGSSGNASVYGSVYTAGAHQVTYSAFQTDGNPEKTAFRVGTDTFLMANDGTLLTEDTSVNMPTLIDRMGIGLNGGNLTQHLNGYVKSIKYYPRRLTNAQLQEITS